jgi:hypothetical protein
MLWASYGIVIIGTLFHNILMIPIFIFPVFRFSISVIYSFYAKNLLKRCFYILLIITLIIDYVLYFLHN